MKEKVSVLGTPRHPSVKLSLVQVLVVMHPCWILQVDWVWSIVLKSPALLFVGGVAVPDQEAIDPYELIEAVEILSKLPKDFYENLVSTSR